MNPLIKADLWLLDEVFQRVSDWTTDHFGRNCFWLARVCLGLTAIADAGLTIKRSYGLVTILLILLGPIYYFVGMTEAEVMKNPKFRNRQRQYHSYRFILIGIALMGNITGFVDLILSPTTVEIILRFAEALGDVTFISAVYFYSCTPRPPRPLPAKAPAGAVPNAA